MMKHTTIAFSTNFRDVEYRGIDAKRARGFIRTLPSKDRERVSMIRTKDHAGVRIRMPVKLLTWLKLDLSTRSRIAA